VGVIHKNIIPFWNLMFRLLSFATPIFYVPFHFKSWWAETLYYVNPFTLFMIWIRDICYANGAPMSVSPFAIVPGAVALFIGSYLLFRYMEAKVGDNL
jgi:ABC-type polysaccharide/polyol phosphate export permease